MSKRTITVVLEIQDEEAAHSIWDAHICHNLLAGCHVVGICNGDLSVADELRVALERVDRETRLTPMLTDGAIAMVRAALNPKE